MRTGAIGRAGPPRDRARRSVNPFTSPANVSTVVVSVLHLMSDSSDEAKESALLEFLRRLVRDAFLEGVKNGRQNRSHPSQRPRLQEGRVADMQRQAYFEGWQHGQSNPNAPAAAACESYVRRVLFDDDKADD